VKHRKKLGSGKQRLPAEDARRRQFVVQKVLFGAVVLALIALIDVIVLRFTMSSQQNDSSLIQMVGLLGFIIVLYGLARRGYYRLSAGVLIGLFFAAATYLIFEWSIYIQPGLLMYAMIIVMTGVMVGTRSAIFMAVACGLCLSALGWLQVEGSLSPDLSWMQNDLHAGDGLVFTALLGITAIIAWLSNHEIDKSLARARSSEIALKHERDNLEVRVRERTQQLEQAQMERVLELQRFAEFGRLSAGLLHDMANPLTIASLNLEELSSKQRSQLTNRATKSIQHLERYVVAARKQLQKTSELKQFSIGAELRQVVSMLSYKAQQCKVAVEIVRTGNINLYGDPVKFNQLVANLIANAIDAYDDVPEDRPGRLIRVKVEKETKYIVLTVQDWGVGIQPKDLSTLFQPFYTTKQSGGRGTGLGLSMVKRIVEEDFHGTIKASSTTAHGTQFIAHLQNGSKPTDN